MPIIPNIKKIIDNIDEHVTSFTKKSLKKPKGKRVIISEFSGNV